MMSSVPESVPAVTIAVTVYSPKYVTQAIDSVLAQTFQDFEIVVVNDGSPETESLERVLLPYQSRIRYFRQGNQGVSVARNTALQAARAQLIVNLDHDDLLEPEHLKTVVGFMREHPDVDATYVNLTYFGGGSLDATHWMDSFPSKGDVSLRSVLAGQTCPANPGSIIRRSTLLRVGPYDPGLDSWEDFDMWLRILSAGGKIAYVREPLVRYRIHDSNLTSRRLRYMENAVRVLDKVEATMQLSPQEAAALAVRRKACVFDLDILRGKEALRRKDWTAASQHFTSCRNQAPTAKLRAVVFALRWCPWLLSAAASMRRRTQSSPDSRQ